MKRDELRKGLHRELAKAEGVGLNQFVAAALAAAVALRRDARDVASAAR